MGRWWVLGLVAACGGGAEGSDAATDAAHAADVADVATDVATAGDAAPHAGADVGGGALADVAPGDAGGSALPKDAVGDAVALDSGGGPADAGPHAPADANADTGGAALPADASDSADVAAPADAGSGTGPDGATPAGCVTTTSAGHHHLPCAGLSYELHIPTACVSGGCGVVLDVHGMTMSGDQEDANTGLRALGEKHGYVVVQPNATPDPPASSWSEADDPLVHGFLLDVIVALKIDPARVHMTGFSQGGFMTWRFLCKHADLFASVAPAAACAGGGFGACSFTGGDVPSRRVPTLFMHGTKDALVAFNCAKKQRDAVVAAWGLTETAVVSQDPNHLWTRWEGEGALFEFVQHDYKAGSPILGGHCYPGSADLNGGLPGQLFGYGCLGTNAFTWGEALMEFFIAHPM
ncbi:MAG: hypothetical protein AMXMBFR64_07950 [Myxococcales bacterium]